MDNRCITCNRIDFLPLTCKYCSKKTCISHINAHDCKYTPAKNSAEIPENKRTIYCNFNKCTKKTLLLITCRVCGIDYCVSHTPRHVCIPRHLARYRAFN